MIPLNNTSSRQAPHKTENKDLSPTILIVGKHNCWKSDKFPDTVNNIKKLIKNPTINKSSML